MYSQPQTPPATAPRSVAISTRERSCTPAYLRPPPDVPAICAIPSINRHARGSLRWLLDEERERHPFPAIIRRASRRLQTQRHRGHVTGIQTELPDEVVAHL